MHDVLRQRLLRRIESLPEAQIYQVLDFIEFLESKYAEAKPAPPGVFQRFAEGVEDTMRAGKMSAGVIGGTMNIMNKAVGAINDVASAGKSVASGIIGVATGGTPDPKEPEAQPPDIPRGGPHELGSQLPKPPGDERK